MKKLLTVLIGVSLALGTVTLSLAGEQDPNGQQPGATQDDGARKARKGKGKGKHRKGKGKGKRHKNPDGTQQTPPAATPPAQP